MGQHMGYEMEHEIWYEIDHKLGHEIVCNYESTVGVEEPLDIVYKCAINKMNVRFRARLEVSNGKRNFLDSISSLHQEELFNNGM